MGINPISGYMHENMNSDEFCIASYVGPRCFASQTRAALEGLGYAVVPAFAMGRFDDTSWRPALRLVDERQYVKIPSPEADPTTPVILLTGPRPLDIDDTRIVGRVPRPAELTDLYPIIQRTLQSTPRHSPRVETSLSARCVKSDRRWMGSVVSLSENGCLFRSSERFESGTQMNLQFALPGSNIISTRAVCVHQHGGESGLAFSDTSEDDQRNIGGFVTHRLATRRRELRGPLATARAAERPRA